MKIAMHPLARREMHLAAEWYERQRPGLGDGFYDRIAEALTLIKQFPDAYAAVGLRCRRIALRRFPYGLIYARPEAGLVLIVATAHVKRRPFYWRRRV